MKYRRDTRSVAKFAQDIKDCTSIERELMSEYVAFLNATKGAIIYTFVDFGIDNSGKLIKEEGKIKATADFLLKKVGGKDKRIEIKFSRKTNPYFHLKTSQLKSYIKHDVCVINFIGIEEKNKRFCIIKPSDMQFLLKKGNKVIFWQKECVRISVKDCIWHNI